MFVQTETTPNPNSLKFLPGKTVSNGGSFEINNKDDVKKAVQHLRANKELLKNMIDKF